MRTTSWPLIAMLVAGCTEGPSTAPSPPGTASSPVPTVQGTVFETTREGRRPVPGAYLNVLTRSGSGGYGLTAYADAEGRYAIGTLPDGAHGAAVLVHAMGGSTEPVTIATSLVWRRL